MTTVILLKYDNASLKDDTIPKLAYHYAFLLFLFFCQYTTCRNCFHGPKGLITLVDKFNLK